MATKRRGMPVQGMETGRETPGRRGKQHRLGLPPVMGKTPGGSRRPIGVGSRQGGRYRRGVINTGGVGKPGQPRRSPRLGGKPHPDGRGNKAKGRKWSGRRHGNEDRQRPAGDPIKRGSQGREGQTSREEHAVNTHTLYSEDIMPKRHRKDNMIGPIYPQFLCEICKAKGQAKWWFTRKDTRDRHLSLHQSMQQVHECPVVGCLYFAPAFRVPDVRIHLLRHHGQDEEAVSWQPGEAVWRRVGGATSEGEPSPRSPASGTPTKTPGGPAAADNTPAGGFNFTPLTTPGYEIGSLPTTDEAATSAANISRMLEDDERFQAGEGNSAGSLIVVEGSRVRLSPEEKSRASPSTTSLGRQGVKRKTGETSEGSKKARSGQTPPAATAKDPDTPKEGGGAGPLTETESSKLKYVMGRLWQTYGREGETPTQMLLRMKDNLPGAPVDLGAVEADYQDELLRRQQATEESKRLEKGVVDDSGSDSDTENTGREVTFGLDTSPLASPEVVIRSTRPVIETEDSQNTTRSQDSSEVGAGRKRLSWESALGEGPEEQETGTPEKTETGGGEGKLKLGTPTEAALTTQRDAPAGDDGLPGEDQREVHGHLSGHSDLMTEAEEATARYQTVMDELRRKGERRKEEEKRRLLQKEEECRQAKKREEEEARRLQRRKLQEEDARRKLQQEEADRRKLQQEEEDRRERDRAARKQAEALRLEEEEARRLRQVENDRQQQEKERQEEESQRQASGEGDRRPEPTAGDLRRDTPAGGTGEAHNGGRIPLGRRPRTITVGLDGLIVTSPAGAFLLQVEVDEPLGGSPDTRVMVPQGVRASVRGAEEPDMTDGGGRPSVTMFTGCTMQAMEGGIARVDAQTRATPVHPTAGRSGGGRVPTASTSTAGRSPAGIAGARPALSMPWLGDYTGPDELRRYSLSLHNPSQLGPDMRVVPGGIQDAGIQTLPNGQIELVHVVRTRYAPAVDDRCPHCGRDWPPEPAATPEQPRGASRRGGDRRHQLGRWRVTNPVSRNYVHKGGSRGRVEGSRPPQYRGRAVTKKRREHPWELDTSKGAGGSDKGNRTPDQGERRLVEDGIGKRNRGGTDEG